MDFKKKGGVVGDLISGTGGLIMITVIVLVIVSTLLGAGLLSDVTSSGSAINESGAFINTTGYTVDNAGATNGIYTATAAWANVSGTAYLVPSTNYTLSTAGVLTNNSIIPNETEYADVNFSYTWTYTGVNPTYKTTTDSMATNLTEGIDNVSTKIPTILLIAAVVLLFGVIVLLVRQAGAMGIGGGGASL